MSRELIIKTEPEIKDVPGRVLSRERFRQIYGDSGHVSFWSFVRDLQNANYSKFCVSGADAPFSRDSEIRFFEISQNAKNKLTEIMYLGKGRTPYTAEITNQYAADTWGFAVLKMKEVKNGR